MITQALQESNDVIDKLLEITNWDIEDIQQANHDAIFERTALKEDLARIFISKKNTVEQAVAELAHDEQDLQNILTNEQEQLLVELSQKLDNLRIINAKLSILVANISNLYESFLSHILPQEGDDAYSRTVAV